MSSNKYRYQSEIFFEEMDAIGLLHHPRYLYHAERAQQNFFQHLLGVKDFNSERDEDIYVVVKSIQLEMKVAVRDPGPIFIDLDLGKIRAGSVVMNFTVLSPDEKITYANGSRTIVKISAKNHQPTIWTDAFRKKLDDWS